MAYLRWLWGSKGVRSMMTGVLGACDVQSSEQLPASSSWSEIVRPETGGCVEGHRHGAQQQESLTGQRLL